MPTGAPGTLTCRARSRGYAQSPSSHVGVRNASHNGCRSRRPDYFWRRGRSTLTYTVRGLCTGTSMSIDIATLRPKLEAALGEQLQLGALLGQGGFAAVFRAHDPFLERDVAIKVLDPSLAVDAALE